MDLVILIGSGAVGKMTVGQELMKITDFRLFHNHMMIEPVIEIFGKFDGAVVSKLRDDIFDAFIKSDNRGMIFTFMWAFDMQSDWDYIKHVSDKFEATGGTVYYVELVADRSVRIERNKTENRLRNKASKRNLAISEDRMLREETKYRLVSNEGEIPFEHYMKIDNTSLKPDVVAKMIKEKFHLPEKGMTEILNKIKLEEVRPDEIEQMYEMQIESFMPLYEKYALSNPQGYQAQSKLYGAWILGEPEGNNRVLPSLAGTYERSNKRGTRFVQGETEMPWNVAVLFLQLVLEPNVNLLDRNNCHFSFWDYQWEQEKALYPDVDKRYSYHTMTKAGDPDAPNPVQFKDARYLVEKSGRLIYNVADDGTVRKIYDLADE